RGFLIDIDLARKAIKADTQHQERLTQEAIKLTGLENPNSVTQLKAWLEEREGIEVESLNKETLPKLMNQVSPTGRRVLEIRRELSKTSVTKEEARERAAAPGSGGRAWFQLTGPG